MPILKLYERGTTAGVAPACNDHQRAKRGGVCGWSHRSIRANTLFLYSVRESGLTGPGLALTLTLAECPPTHRHWADMVRAFIRRMGRMGMVRLHWLTEWQKRRCPHLHAAIWFQEDDKWLRERVLRHWLEVAAPYGALRRSQTAEPIHDSGGWFEYVSKHAGRGLANYQRAGAGIPPGWEKTGRMWGHCGDWSLADAQEFDVPASTFHAYRRIVRAWRKADARSDGKPKRIAQARRMLQSSDRGLCAVRGVSEWIPLQVSICVLILLRAHGYRVEQR